MGNVTSSATGSERPEVVKTQEYEAGYSPQVRALEFSSISWRAIFAGTLTAFLSYGILMTLGLGFAGSNLSDIVQGQQRFGAFGAISGLWIGISALISLFLGGLLAGRVSHPITSRIGAMQGLVIAALFFAFLFWQASQAIQSVGSRVGGFFGSLGGAVTDIAANPEVIETIERAIPEANLRAPLPEIAQGVAIRMIRGNDQAAAEYLARMTGLPVEQALTRVQGIGQDFRNVLGDIASGISTAAWTLFITMVLGSVAALVGGGLGARSRIRYPMSERDRDRAATSRAA